MFAPCCDKRHLCCCLCIYKTVRFHIIGPVYVNNNKVQCFILRKCLLLLHGVWLQVLVTCKTWLLKQSQLVSQRVKSDIFKTFITFIDCLPKTTDLKLTVSVYNHQTTKHTVCEMTSFSRCDCIHSWLQWTVSNRFRKIHIRQNQHLFVTEKAMLL